MSESNDRSEKPSAEESARPALESSEVDNDYFGPIMTREEAEALRQGELVDMKTFKERFDLS